RIGLRSRKSAMRNPQSIRIPQSAIENQFAIRNPQSAIRDAMLTLHLHDLGSAEIPPARALLAVRRAAGAADRGGARLARSRSARGALRRTAAAVLDLARLSAARRPRLRRGARDRARVGGVPRDRRRAGAALSRALLVERRV